MNYLGDFPTGATVYCPFSTYGLYNSSVTISGLATSDIKIYKDGSTTQRSSEAGYTLLDTDGIDFDGITGIHGFSIDLSDNTDAGFYAAGHEYWVVVNSITIDSETVNLVAGTFSIERSGGALALLKHANYGLSKLVRSTTPENTLTVDASHQALADVSAISGDSTAADRLEAILDAMPGGAVVDDNDPDPTATAFETNLTEATNDHYNGAFVVFTSGALLGQSRKISDYDGTNKILTVAAAFTEAPTAGDTFLILGRSE